MGKAQEAELARARAANRERGGTDPVPDTSTRLPLLAAAQLLVLRKVVGPIRRRRRREPLPPPLSGPETARRLFNLPVSYWSYDWEPGRRHLGPMSQDFAAAFGLGGESRRIHMVDANGVAVVAIQSLHRTVTRLEADLALLQERLGELENVTQTSSAVSAGERNDAATAARLDAHSGAMPQPNERQKR